MSTKAELLYRCWRVDAKPVNPRRFLLLAVLAQALGATASGCTPVKPWQREILANPVMRIDADPTAARIREGLLSYREGSTGALGTRGGGCGCD